MVLLKSERGFSLIEVTVALGLMGIIVVAFL
ncbi:MAG: prepilin-type N-terminal cleavage/methylation domain-containing protein, partial [Dehalococcoidia bacterium]